MRIKKLQKEWRRFSRYLPRTYGKPSSVLKAALADTGIRTGMCKAIRNASSSIGLTIFSCVGLFTRTAYLRYHWTRLEVWRRWWNDDPYWDDASDEAAERRIAFIKHLIKKLEKHGL